MDTGKTHALFSYLVLWTGRTDWWVEWDPMTKRISATCDDFTLEPQPTFEDAVTQWKAATTPPKGRPDD